MGVFWAPGALWECAMALVAGRGGLRGYAEGVERARRALREYAMGAVAGRGHCGRPQWVRCSGEGCCVRRQWARWLDEAIVHARNGRGAGLRGGAYARNGLFCPVLVGGLFRGYDGGFFEDGFDFGDGAL